MDLKILNVNHMTEIPKIEHEKHFTGDFMMRKMAEEITSEEEIYYVEFRGGCTTRPHIHMSEQILIPTEGKGTVVFVEKMDVSDQSGSTRILNKEYEIKKGDVVRVPAGLIHWHGAMKGEDFSHIAIRKKTNIENIWL